MAIIPNEPDARGGGAYGMNGARNDYNDLEAGSLGPNTDLGEISLDWARPPTLMDLKADLEEALPHHRDQVSRVDAWLDNLRIDGKARVKAPPGRSSVVPKLIRKQAEWRYSALSEPFLSTDNLFSVNPETWEDTHAAEQNRLVLNHQFTNRIDRSRFIDEYVRSAVDEGTAIVRVGWKYEDEEVEEEVPVVDLIADPAFEGVLAEVAALREGNPGAYESDIPPELKEALEASGQLGRAHRPEIVGYETVTVRQIRENRPTLEVCDYPNVYIDPTCQGDIEKAGFIVFSFESSLSELEKDGRYANLSRIDSETNSITGEPEHASSTGGVGTRAADGSASGTFNFRDRARKKFVVYEYWGFRDVEGMGRLTPITAAWVGNTLIRLADNPFPDKALPFVLVPYLPVRRSVYGEPDGALLEENQQIMGAVTRGMIDLLGRSANGQTGMRRDMLDATNLGIGRIKGLLSRTRNSTAAK